MKIIQIRLTKAAAVTFIFSELVVKVLGYPVNYGPFPPGHEPTAISLAQCKLEREVKSTGEETDGAVRIYCLPVAGTDQKQNTLALRGTTNGWEIKLSDGLGKSLMHVPFTNSMTSSLMEVYSSDLNGDGQPDFMVNVWSGGCGLAAEASEVTFLLSGKDGYRATSFYLYDFGKPDLVRFQPQGPVYFIFNDLMGNDGEKTRDGRDHNFWVYNLHRIDGSRFIPADADQLGFPKWIWYRNQATHEETTQLSQEQKIRLLMKRKNINAHQ